MKKLISALLATSMVFGLTACGSETTDTQTTANDQTTAAVEETTTAKVVEKPSKITIMCDGTVITEDDDAQAFYDDLSAATGITLEWIRPDHSGYADQVNNVFTTGTNLPDVVLLPYDSYATYASLGYLWDMTEAWDNSEVKNSGRLVDSAEALFEANKVTGEDGELGLYGFIPQQGNGCLTYIKQSWLDAAGITTLPTTYAEYYDMLVKMKEATGKAPVAAAGVIGTEAPYINYLPEFYQDAYPEFYEKDGVWVDGFSEDAMKDALQRLADAYKDGLLAGDIFTLTTKECRTLYEEDQFGVFTYWAGTWRGNLITNIQKANNYAAAETETLAVLEPIAEVGAYLNRFTPLWCITTSCENPEGVFEYFLQKMLDGGECQMLWEYGSEGTHYTYDGTTFTQLNRKSTDKAGTKNHIDPMLKLGEFASDYNNGVDVGLSSAKAEAVEAMEIFNRTSKQAPAIKKTEAFTDYSAKIWSSRSELVAKVVKGEITVDDAMATYASECGEEIEAILDSLNN
jgi:ABC-type glycerol-3-phosphate transport system substrate-binding protein